MTVETDIFTALKALVSSRVYRDIAPANVTTLPRITFQQVGGLGVNFVDPTVPSKKNCRMQINVWHSSRDEATELARQVEDALRAYTALQTTVLGSFVSVYEPDTGLYGTMQDFSFWS
ncbi:MAG: DUF3168 domain-containing protein [Betaproteobacteria bacterium]|nr:DUF3168 domain-containing protein [Betaproteobacteria bacterium]